MEHLCFKHKISAKSKDAARIPDQRNTVRSEYLLDSGPEPEEERPPASVEDRCEKRNEQLKMERFLTSKHTLRSDTMKLICQSNVSINRIAKDATIRRLLCTTHPRDDPPPRSGTTLSKYLREDAEIVKKNNSACERRLLTSHTHCL